MFKITAAEKEMILRHRALAVKKKPRPKPAPKRKPKADSDVLKEIKVAVKRSSVPKAMRGHSSIRGAKPIKTHGYILKVHKIGSVPDSVTVKLTQEDKGWIKELKAAFKGMDYDFDGQIFEFALR